MLKVQELRPTSSLPPIQSSNARLKDGGSFNATNNLLPSHIIVTFGFKGYLPLDLDLHKIVVDSPEGTPPDSPTLTPPPSLSFGGDKEDKDQQPFLHHSQFTPLSIPSITLCDEDKIGDGAIAECYETTYNGTPIVLKCVRNIDNEGYDCEQHRLRLRARSHYLLSLEASSRKNPPAFLWPLRDRRVGMDGLDLGTRRLFLDSPS
ncbi:hypothetical protein BT96DRAFT_989213 [Gymnopus androsaceus JB14]|uniref:Uncharacterized protein n=1 Tax=Gymnopus androsaceus JB14 TaxID=1447944 RepID=A0A6A4HZ21_9AGAR|nr:hypothetical protein BT96DRAFT_989213 [Gymnopus androsaceus JB14]